MTQDNFKDDPYAGLSIEELKHIINFWRDYGKWKEANYELLKLKGELKASHSSKCLVCGVSIKPYANYCADHWKSYHEWKAKPMTDSEVTCPPQTASHSSNGERDWEVMQMKQIRTENIHEWNDMCHAMGCSIYSVRRKSDGVVFTVGDELVKWGKIISFKIQSEKFILALCDDGKPQYINVVFEDWIKAQPLPKRTKLFTTEDGVDVFEGDKYWYLTSIGFKPSYKPFECTYASKGESWPKDWKYFSTEEKAQEYITLNKPCLSAKEVIDIWAKDIYLPKAVKELAKSKLK